MPATGQVLGLEGTAWNLSAALFDDDLLALRSDPYVPPTGGIHPREAAQHHAARMSDVIAPVLATGCPSAVAFSQGPGLGPCLRTVATAARSLAIALGVPLIGVNHCLAHVEIGRFATGCTDPVVLYASGANTQVIGYLSGRYRVFGETLDIGLGNALDKFARSRGLPHPGGPRIEELAHGGGLIDLPYTVKGMDLAFSGLVTAASSSTAPLADVCRSLQETAFAMCVEVTERALAHAGKEEVLLVGGVGANKRLQEMLRTMCEDRGATFHVPEPAYLGDNAAMIAYTGRLQAAHGMTVAVADSQVDPNFRIDQVPCPWRVDRPETFRRVVPCGAEAEVELGERDAIKRRQPKRYRLLALDERLRLERTRSEARLLSAARRAGVATPVVRDIDGTMIVMERIEGEVLKAALDPAAVNAAGSSVGLLHGAGIVHGDLTSSNMVVRDGRVVLIDFGLAQATEELEARGVDVHVLLQTLASAAADPSPLTEAFVEGYRSAFSGADAVLERETEIRRRGRYL
ncbi:MAG: bifunctional N(6)-L-threonylcarbamoyladenine synthase/serine/threonine protein kinase [Methanospirillum sp.]